MTERERAIAPFIACVCTKVLLTRLCLFCYIWISSPVVGGFQITHPFKGRVYRFAHREQGPSHHHHQHQQQLVLDTEQLKRRIPLSTVFHGYGVELTPLGPHKHRCLCPFHGDQEPSMLVNDEPAYYYCFSCGTTGNVVNFVSKKEKITYSQATAVLKRLTRRETDAVEATSPPSPIEENLLQKLKGILQDGMIHRLPESNYSFRPSSSFSAPSSNIVIKPTISDEKLLLSHRVLKEAEDFFANRLLSDPQASLVREYLVERGLSPATIARFGLGFSPSQKLPLDFSSVPSQNIINRSLTAHLLSRLSVTLQDLVDCGLTKIITNANTGKQTFYDRFRNRLMIPIRDQHGNCIAFGGRTMEDYKESQQVENPPSAFGKKEIKYINSPTTAAFEKKMRLFGIDSAQSQSAKLDFVIMVEGYFDVISLYEAGIHNVVAALGTAISLPQLLSAANLTRSGTVVLLLDGDSAGQQASRRAAGLPKRHEQGMLRKGITTINNELPSRKLLLKAANISDSLEFIRLHNLRSKRATADGEIKIKDCADIFEHFSVQETRKILHYVVQNAVEVFSGDIITEGVLQQ